MPLDVLPDLPAFRDLLVSYVKAGWRDAHTNRERLPKGFGQGLKFDLVGIEDGSAVPAIRWDKDSAQMELPEFRDEIEELVGNAYDKIIALFDNANSPTIADSLNADEVRAMNRFGSALQNNERIEFVGRRGSDGNVVYLDAFRRKKLLTRGRNVYESRFDSVGKLLGCGVDEAGEQGHVEVSTVEHGVLRLPLSAERVREEFDGRIDTDLQFELTIDLDGNDRFVRVKDVHEIDLIDAQVVADLERCRARISNLSSLQDDWHNGFGKAPSDDARGVAFRLLARNPTMAGLYHIFPTENGGLAFEFKIKGWDYSVDIHHDGRVEIYGFAVSSDEEMGTEILDTEGDQFREQFNKITGGSRGR